MEENFMIIKEEKTIYTVYAQDEDMTYIMEETYRTGKLHSLEVVGFYHGMPTQENTELYRGKTKALYNECTTAFPETVKGKFDDEFKLALVTGEFVFYVNEEECDDNANVIMYRQENFTLLSDNYFANGAFMEELEAIYKGKYKPEFMSDNTEENLKLIAETGYFEEN